jgi:hypothetical protein
MVVIVEFSDAVAVYGFAGKVNALSKPLFPSRPEVVPAKIGISLDF